jgi:hypothetical protein
MIPHTALKHNHTSTKISLIIYQAYHFKFIDLYIIFIYLNFREDSYHSQNNYYS